MPKTFRLIAAFAVSMLLACSLAHAEDAYPSKLMRVVVPFPPGGPADLIARLIGQKLSEGFGKQFYIENHSGAGGNLGTGIAAHAPGDGYTIMITSQALVINTSLYKSLPYDPFKDFIAVTRIATTPTCCWSTPTCRPRPSRSWSS
jgi:tripartite-type tricarboxylate transporter receptor subunit TctC